MDTYFSQVTFCPDSHSYRMNGQELTSVTKFLGQFKKPFDRMGIAQKVADREGRSVSDVLAEWDTKSKNALDLGTRVHEHIRKVLSGEKIETDPFLSLNETCPEIEAFDKLYSNLTAKTTYVEWVIGDAELGIAGTVDALFHRREIDEDHHIDEYHIFDWKTGKFDMFNNFENLLPPFNEFDASQLNIYSLQLSLYRFIIERNTPYKMGDSYIAHLASNGEYHLHKAVDMRDYFRDFFA